MDNNAFRFYFKEAEYGYLVRAIDITVHRGKRVEQQMFDEDTPIRVNPQTHIAYIDKYLVQLQKTDYTLII